MTLQKIRADKSTTQTDGAIVHSARWFGGPSLAKVTNCRVVTLYDEPRVTAYVQGEADTYFSIPVKFRFGGKVLNGYLTSADDDSHDLVLHHCYY